MTATQLSKIEAHGRQLLAIFPNATECDPVKLCKKLRRLEIEASEIALRLCNGPEYESDEQVDGLTNAILAKVNKLLGNVHAYQPKTGAKCSCKRGIQRDNCSTCEGTGYVIDFKMIRHPRPLVPVFINRDPRGYALKIDDEWLRKMRDNPNTVHLASIERDWGGYGIIAPEITD